MKKAVIKIVKGNKNENEEKITTAAPPLKAEIDLQQNMAEVVANWISERSKNRIAEKSFSDESITAWKNILYSQAPDFLPESAKGPKADKNV